MDRKLLLLSSRPEDRAFVDAIAAHNHLEVVEARNARDAADRIKASAMAAIFVDVNSKPEYEAFEKEIHDRVGVYSDNIRANNTHYISDLDIEEIGFIFGSPIFGSYIFRNYGDPAAAGSRYALIVAATLKDRAFGIFPLLKPPRNKVQTVRFKNTSEKLDGVEAVKNYLVQAKFKLRMATVIANAMDELVMNAMFDAPVDALGKPVYLTTPRSTSLDISADHPVEMNVGFDGEYAVVSAVDHYGSLDRNILFAHLAKTYKAEEYKIKTSSAGAGIGLANVFRSGGSFLFLSDKGARTEVVVFFKRSDNFREFKDQFRFIATQFYF